MLHPDLQPSGPTPGGQPDRLLAGKYRSVDEMEKGHENLHATLMERNRRIAELEAQVNAARQPNYQDELGQIGVPPEAVEAAAATVFERMFTPYIRGQEARSSAMRRHQVLAQNEDAVVQFLQANPDKLQQFQQAWNSGLYDMAYDWAATEYERSAQLSKAPNPMNRLDGFMPPAGSGRTIQSQANLGEQRGREIFAQTGSPIELIKARLANSGLALSQRGVQG